MNVDLEKKIGEALERAAQPLTQEPQKTLAALCGDYCALKLTETGLKNGIMDATKDVRLFLSVEGIHDYSLQEQGEENKKMVDAYFLNPRPEKTEASLYRPVTKKGDPRIWFKQLKKYARPNDTLYVFAKGGKLYVLNTSHKKMDQVLEDIKKGTSPLAKKSSLPIPDLPPIPKKISVTESPPREIKPIPETGNEIKGKTGATPKEASPGQEPEVIQSNPHEMNTSLQVNLGEDRVGQPVTWEPFHRANRLSNAHVAILGGSGTGKSQTMKVLIREMCENGVFPIILDWHDDYIKEEFRQVIGNPRFHEADKGLSFNPLCIEHDANASGTRVIMTHVYKISEMFNRAFDLGPIQQRNLRNALCKTYESIGLSRYADSLPPDTRFPEFNELRDFLDEEGDHSLNNRLDPLFDLQLFQGDVGFQDGFLNEPHIIWLKNLPNDYIKKAVSGILLMGIYASLLRAGEYPNGVRIAVVVDEAHKVANLDEMNILLKESRKYGCAVLLSSQEAKDFSDSIYSNVGTLLCLGLNEPGNSEKIAKQLGSHSNFRDLADKIRDLPNFEGYIKNNHYSPYSEIKVKPYFDRYK